VKRIINPRTVPFRKQQLTQKGVLVFLFFSITFSLSSYAQCYQAFQFAFGGSGSDVAYDITDAGNNQFYVVGTTNSYGAGGTDIMVVKTDAGGNILWSKVFGGANDELVRKAKKTKDGGLLITGQTKSFGNANGDMLCLKVNANGSLAWSREFGVGSSYGDLGMDIIETSDGGYAVSGIINVHGGVADAVIIKLNTNADITWTKRFDRGDGEDGVGVIENGTNLIATCDLQNSGLDYDFAVLQIRESDGKLITMIILVKTWGYVTNLDFSVYNRWGNLIFHSTSSLKCWDGTYNGIRQASGTYVYQVSAKTICGNVYRKGTIVLIR